MEEQIIRTVFKREEIWNPKNSSHKKCEYSSQVVVGNRRVGKDGK
jgi:hypothetical protein